MTIRNDNHRVANIIKGLEQRIADLEEQDRSDSTPTLLRTVIDRVTVNDRLPAPREKQLQTAMWNNDTTGWRTSTWGKVE